jgi:hypothetical protein
MIGKSWISKGLEYLKDGLLNQMVDHCWNTERACPTTWLWDSDASDFLWFIRSIQEAGSESLNVLCCPRAQLFNRHAVDSR